MTAKKDPPPRPAPPVPAPAPPPPSDPPPPSEAPPRMPDRHEPDPPSHPHDAAAPVRVRALRDGYYEDKYRRAGDVFTLAPGEALARWMEAVDPDTPEHLTTSTEALRQANADIRTQRVTDHTGVTGGLTAPIDNPEGGPDPLGAREG